MIVVDATIYVRLLYIDFYLFFSLLAGRILAVMMSKVCCDC